MKTSVFSFFLLLMIAAPLAAQSPNTATLLVDVVDQTGAVVKDAKVSVVNAATDAVRNAVSGSDGSVTIPALSLTGSYTVSVSKEGFGSEERSFSIAPDALTEIRSRFTADRADEDETAATIRTVQREAGYLIDPHTAVAVAVAEKENRDRAVPMVVLSTAHPAKFPDAVEAACATRPTLPDWLGDLDARPERLTVLPAEQGAVEKFIMAASRAAREGAAA